jgi:hypothetical protein
VAHASPRWRGANTTKDADAKNMALSKRRADTVRVEVEKAFAKEYPEGVSVEFDEHVAKEEPPGTVSVDTEAHGSSDTLREAKGNRSDDKAGHRRVDVYVTSSRTRTGVAHGSQRLRYWSTDSQFWYVNIMMTAGGSIGAAGGMLTMQLTNAATGDVVEGHVFLFGGGPKASLGTSTGPWSSPTSFMTDRKVNFEDFQNNWINYTTASASLFIGYERAYISFTGLGPDAKLINVSGATVGTAGLGAASLTGSLTLNEPLPSRSVPIEHSDEVEIPYERGEHGEDAYSVGFATEHADLSPAEVALLTSFVGSVVAIRR